MTLVTVAGALGAGAKGSDRQELSELAELFGLLSDPTRLNLLLRLSRGERNVTSLCRELGLPQPTVSHHLGLLRAGGLAACRRAGKQMFYGLGGQVESSPGTQLAFSVGGLAVHVSGLDEAAE